MITCKLAVCAESVVRDAETNAVSVFNIVEAAQGKGFPLVVPRLSCLFILTREDSDPTDYSGSMRIAAGTREIAQYPISVNFQDSCLNRSIVVIEGLVVPGPGPVQVSLWLRDEEKGMWQFEVKKVGGPEVEMTQG